MTTDHVATDDSTTETTGPTEASAATGNASTKTARRRASRPTGPAAGTVAQAPTAVRVQAPEPARVRVSKPVVAPPRRAAHRGLVAAIGLGVLALLVAATGALVGVFGVQEHRADAAAARNQQFVDTATNTVVNMFSYDQNTIDDSVNRFVNGTSGPLRDMLSQNNNVDNLKAMFRDTQASSETVVTGAALERVDEIAKNASVIVSARTTVTDLDGVNKPSQPYRYRIIVHEDDNGHMTGYDLKYPDGGN
ncbi:mammalian cell entry protein [Mycolicibacterium sediminis]|uniref:Mammalian cell entry protein n=1 Tax=Mycolicibacterium sediminis TaxID=1286180 RepID=A0A7I7QIE5_9MYCO|nr:mammalian cell entry protein [Mycolicibacterium sediminis]BBY26058.1 mammalian cell entry protein [Mycolicibacterium sediminis]